MTYKVETLTDAPLNLYISYKDSTDYVNFYTTDKNWSKEVVLSHDDLALLLVSVSYRFDQYPDYCLDQLLLWDDFVQCSSNTNQVFGKIIHSEKGVSEHGEDFVLISMFRPGYKGSWLFD